VTYVESTAALLELTEYAAIYWPWIKIVNPNKNVFGDGDDIVVAPSGFVVGVYARTDGSQPGGVYLQPAGVDQGQVFGCIGFETTETEDERKRDLVYPKRINPITTERGLPRYIDGSRTLKSSGNFPSVGERRGVIYIEFSLKRGLAFTKHKNHTPALRATVRRTAYAFLITQMRNNAFASNEPAKAFFVDVSEALNPPSVVFVHQLIARIGLATAKPTEWVILKFVQDTRALEEELAG
jgi:phage tail sheath protein FI